MSKNTRKPIMRNNKSGELQVQLKNLIVLLVVLLLFLTIIFTYVLPYAQDTYAVRTCQTSIIAADKDIFGVVELSCRMSRLIVKKSDVLKEGEVSKDKLLRKVADKMVDCWSMVSDGKLKFVSESKGGLGPAGHCLLCAKISFDYDLKDTKQEKKSIVISDKEFKEWIEDEHNKPAASGKKYSELLGGWYDWMHSIHPNDADLINLQGTFIDTNEEYYIRSESVLKVQPTKEFDPSVCNGKLFN